jgi:uncharacterized protein involved in response to NO
MTQSRFDVLLGRAFRPFFLLAGVSSVVLVALWLGILRGVAPPPSWPDPFLWHAHEMLFGFAASAIAGFLLTSIPVWTGRSALTGVTLAALASLWLLGRIAVFVATSLPSAWMALLVDVGFFASLAGWSGLVIYGSRSKRNYAFPLLLMTLAISNALTHLGALGIVPWAGTVGLRLGLGCVVLLISILGGRLVPLFTLAALQRQGQPVEIEPSPWADRASSPLIAAFFVGFAFWPHSMATAGVALAAAVATVLRSRGWHLRASLRDPLLWSMHFAYLWIPLGLGAFALAALSPRVSPSIAIHALTVGAVGGMILAIMTRVALGHTGRAMVAPPGMALGYALVAVAALIRTLGLVLLPDRSAGLLMMSGGAWMLGFGIFLVVYAPMLARPRIDGNPG